MYCKQCHYPLTGLGREVCPECGRAFRVSDNRSFDPFATGSTTALRQYLQGATALIASTVSAVLVVLNGPDLLLWHFGRGAGVRLLWGMRRHIDVYDVEFLLGGLMMLVSLWIALMPLRRSNGALGATIILSIRCAAFAAATWWIGWYLAMHYGYLFFPLYPMFD